MLSETLRHTINLDSRERRDNGLQKSLIIFRPRFNCITLVLSRLQEEQSPRILECRKSVFYSTRCVLWIKRISLANLKFLKINHWISLANFWNSLEQEYWLNQTSVTAFAFANKIFKCTSCMEWCWDSTAFIWLDVTINVILFSNSLVSISEIV